MAGDEEEGRQEKEEGGTKGEGETGRIGESGYWLTGKIDLV